MITKIRFQNFNGQSREQPLTGRDIFLGPNGTGKSTIIQAAVLTQLGYIPGEGKTTAQIFKHAAGDSMTVGIDTSTGFSCSRTIERKAKKNKKTGEVTYSLSESVEIFPGRGERTDTEKRARIEEEMGNLPVILDFEVFQKMTDTQKRDFIYSLGQTETDISKDDVRAYLEEEILTAELLEGNKEQYDVAAAAIAELMEKYPEDLPTEEAIAALLDLAKNEYKLWKSKANDSKGAARQLAELKNQTGITDRDLARKKEELKDLQARQVELAGQLEGDRAKKTLVDNRTNEIARYEQLLAGIAKTRPAEEIDQDIARLESEIDKTDYMELFQENQRQIEALEQKKTPLRKKAEAISKKAFEITTQMDALKEKLKTVEQAEGCCVLHKNIECPKDFSGFRAFVEETAKKVEKSLAQLHDMQNQVANEMAKIDLEIEGLRKKRLEIQSAANAAKAKNKELQEKIFQLQQERWQSLVAKSKKKEYEETLDRLRNMPVPAIGDIELMEKEMEQLTSAIKETEARIEEINSAREKLVLFQQSVINNQEAELKMTAYEWIKEALGPKGLQGEVVKLKVEPLRAHLKGYMKTLGIGHEPFFEMESETGQEIFDFGWVNEKGQKVYFDTLSEGQKILFITAMTLVFLDRANPKHHLLFLDNVNHLDKENFSLLLAGLSQVKADNIILAGAIGFDFVAPEGWEVWKL